MQFISPRNGESLSFRPFFPPSSPQPPQVFVDAGVPHVVAVCDYSFVRDSIARSFSSEFYYNLLVLGHTIQESFDVATQRIATGKRIARPTHIISQYFLAGAEHRTQSELFRLLPEGSDHNVRLINVGPGSQVPRSHIDEERFQDLTPPLANTNMGEFQVNYFSQLSCQFVNSFSFVLSQWHMFGCRNTECQRVVGHLLNHQVYSTTISLTLPPFLKPCLFD